MPTDVVLSRSETNDDVILKVAGTNDVLTIQGGDYISEIQFADGTIWDRQYVMSVLMTGTPADDRLIGTDADDVLDGGAGNDYLDGRAGTDTYVFGLGYGNDVVNDSSDANVLHLNAGVTSADVVLSLGGSENLDVILSIEGTPDALTFLELLPAYRSSGDGITEIHFSDGTVWDAQTITSKFISATPGDDVIVGFWTSDKIDAGAGNDVLSGGLGADSLIGGSGDDTLDGQADKDWFAGAEGNDIYVVNEAGEVTLENPDEGLDLVKSSVSWSLAANVENLTLTSSKEINGVGNDLDNVIVGNISVNHLTGGAGNDRLDGGSGADTLIGGIGDDVFVVGNSGDVVTEEAGEGTDRVESSISYSLGVNIENLKLLGVLSGVNGAGNELDNFLTGNVGSNKLTGFAGNDTIDGGGNADTLVGGVGNDTYIINQTGVVITENFDEGIDKVESSVTISALADNVEILVLKGASAISVTGNGIDNHLTGNSAANTLNGGAGADTLVAGAGNDTYVVDNAADVTTENEAEGTDIVQSSIAWALAANIENLTLTGNTAISGTGNDLNNLLTGNTGVNTLIGGSGDDTLNGGTGADKLEGGVGNDTYMVDNTSELLNENADEGVDFVQSSATYTLADNVENLTLTGSSALIGTGNGLDNIITGNSGANQLNGGGGNDRLDGGAGNDKMTGGIGDDTYVVAQAGDSVIEAASEGIDTVESSITITALATNVENLILTGASAINGTGNTLDNAITGNGSANTLNGGSGKDTLLGGTGTDNLLGGDGDDLLVWDGADTLNGGVGLDTLRFASSGTLQFDSARMLNLEAVDLGAADDNNNGIALSVADVLSLSSSSSGSGISANGDNVDLFILGDVEGEVRDAINLSGGWTAAGTLSTSSLNGTPLAFDLYQANGVQVAVQQGLDQLIA